MATVLREPVELTVAGRTDTGVHALGQVASFNDRSPRCQADLTRRLNGAPARRYRRNLSHACRRLRRPRDATSPAPTATEPSSAPPPCPFEQGRSLWWPHKPRPRRPRRLRHIPDRHRRLHRLHPDPNRPRPLRERHLRPQAGASDGDIVSFHITADAFMRETWSESSSAPMLEASSGRRIPRTS